MKDTEFIKEAMYVKRIKASELSERCGYKAQSNLNSAMSAKDGMRTTTFIKLLDALGLALNVVDKETGALFAKVGENGFEITDSPVLYYKPQSPTKTVAAPNITNAKEAPSDLLSMNLDDMTIEELQIRMKMLGEAVRNDNIPQQNREAYANEYIEVFSILKQKTALAEAQAKLK